METCEGARYTVFMFWFKSYYVVWKHCWRAYHDNIFDQFKSYYVVWKLGGSMI